MFREFGLLLNLALIIWFLQAVAKNEKFFVKKNCAKLGDKGQTMGLWDKKRKEKIERENEKGRKEERRTRTAE